MTTKEQERKALEQIKKIVAGLGEDSYIGMAFEGCFEIAAENIENDFGCSMKQRAESAEKTIEELRGTLAHLQGVREHLQKQLEDDGRQREYNFQLAQEANQKVRDLTERIATMEKYAKEADEQINSMQDVIDEKDAEIMKLKARLYDLITK